MLEAPEQNCPGLFIIVLTGVICERLVSGLGGILGMGQVVISPSSAQALEE